MEKFKGWVRETMEKIEDSVQKYWKHVVAGVLIILVICFMIWGNIWFWLDDIWCWLRMGSKDESYGATLRNLTLIVAPVLGLGLAIWRNRTADKQTKIANTQADTAIKQAEASERGQNNERFQRGAEMLGSAQLATRFGGISALARLAEEHPKEYHIQIMDLIGAFVRDPTEDKALDGSEGASNEGDGAGGTSKSPKPPKCRPDVEEAVRRAVGGRTEEQHKVEKQYNVERKETYRIDIMGAKLMGANLSGANLSYAKLFDVNLMGANLFDANLSRALLLNANLSAVTLMGANLSHANLRGANLSRAILTDANLTGADFTGATHLTQDQLDLACQKNPNGRPPKLPSGLTWNQVEAIKRRHMRYRD